MKRTIPAISLGILGLLLVLFIIIPDVSKRFDDYSIVVLDASGTMLRPFLNAHQQWCFPDDDAPIPQKLVTAILQFEDRGFYHHIGINPIAVIRAGWQNLRYGKVISGASTITMQVARISRPKSRTIGHKIIEMAEAIKLEILYSKETILRLYVHHAPYGHNLVGIRAASLKYFGKEPAYLTWSEAALLAVLPNAPGLIAPGTRQNELIKKRDLLLRQLHAESSMDAHTLALCLAEPVPDEMFSMPMLAPHAAQFLKNASEQSIIHSTIDATLQQQAEEMVARYGQTLGSRGIENCALLICETSTGKVRAYCGSQGFTDFSHQGQVDGVQAARSTGSTLKPFLYALSIDRGLVVPQTLLSDIPTYYQGFVPENANHRFSGTVSAHQALVRSLNVPAVRLLNAYGLEDFYDFLQRAGSTTLFRSADGYGLTLIIGGSETTLWDITSLYRGLGNYGNFEPLSLLQDASAASSNKLISPGAAYMVLNVIDDLKRPGGEYYWDQYENAWPLAWKTGTSYGQRDGWAVGVNPQWTIGVWTGNFSGEGNGALSGAASAGPLLFEAFNSLPKEPQKRWFEPPLSSMDAVVICHESGYSAGPSCTKRDTIVVPKQQYPLKRCPYHHTIQVNDDESFQVCSLCWEQDYHHTKDILTFPPALSHYRRLRGLGTDAVPPHNPSCPGYHAQAVITVEYPTQDAHLVLPRDFGGERQKLTLRATHRDDSALLYWYLDDDYLGITKGHHNQGALLQGGKHRITVIDEVGNRASVSFWVSQ